MIVITGGAGFIGSALVWYLNLKGIDEIVVVDSFHRRPEKWKNLRGLAFVDVIPPEEVFDYLIRDDKVDLVINLGACSDTRETDFEFLLENNYRFARELCEECLKRGVRFVHASSAATYGLGEVDFSDDHKILPQLRPLNGYAFSKHLFDLWALRTGVLDRITVLKYFNVFGPNEYHKGNMRSMVAKAYDQIRASGKVCLFKSTDPRYPNGGQMRDFVYVKDAVAMTWFLAERGAGGIFNIGTGKPHTWLDLVKAIFSAMGREPVIEFVEMPEDLKAQYQNYTCAEMGKLAKEGFPLEEITPLEEAVKDYLQNYLVPMRYLGDDVVDRARRS